MLKGRDDCTIDPDDHVGNGTFAATVEATDHDRRDDSFGSRPGQVVVSHDASRMHPRTPSQLVVED